MGLLKMLQLLNPFKSALGEKRECWQLEDWLPGRQDKYTTASQSQRRDHGDRSSSG